MASRPSPKKQDASQYYEVRTVVERVERDRAWWELPTMVVGMATVWAAVILLVIVPFGSMVHDFYWPKPVPQVEAGTDCYQQGESGWNCYSTRTGAWKYGTGTSSGIVTYGNVAGADGK